MVWVLLRPTRVSESAVRRDVPGAVSPVGGKGATKVLKQKPLGTDPHLTISKQSSEYWLLIGHKKCLYYCPQSGNSIAWVCLSVFVLDCYCLAIQCCTCPVRLRLCGARETFIFYFTNQKRNYRLLGKTFGRTIQICTSFLIPAPPPSRLPHSFASSPLYESLEQAKELKVLVRSVRTSHAFNFQDMWKWTSRLDFRRSLSPISRTAAGNRAYQAYNYSKSRLRPWKRQLTIRLTFVILTKLKLRKGQSYS